MSADKRSVATDALETLGTIISENEKRDAIHLGVEPVVAGQTLHPGEHIGLNNEGLAVNRQGVKLLGIVDPFLLEEVTRGQRFWLVVYPRQITSLRHVWTHPDFPESKDLVEASNVPDVETSEKWLHQFIDNADCPSYNTVIEKALNNDSWDSDYLHFDGEDAHGEIPPEFWTHLEIVTGSKIPQESRANYFSCSC